ncbi:MAG: DUF2807 domain-containing protein [Actinomycetia bacterium]|nr:DUF2807 domain-containing protein [Actinomycetes bacterium]
MTSRLIARIVGVGLVAVVLAACGSDEPVPAPSAATVEVAGSFSAIQAADGFVVTVERAESHSVTVSAIGIDPAELDVGVDGNTLQLRTASGSVPDSASLSAVVRTPSARKLTATSGAQVTVLAPMTLGGEQVKVDLTAGARFEGEVSAKALTIGMQAGAEAQVSGSSRSVTIVGSEAAQLGAADLTVADADVSLTTAAVATLTVNETLRASLSSGAELTYSGDPKITKRSVDTGADLVQADS